MGLFSILYETNKLIDNIKVWQYGKTKYLQINCIFKIENFAFMDDGSDLETHAYVFFLFFWLFELTNLSQWHNIEVKKSETRYPTT